MGKHKIEWTDETWNPVTGCDKISAGCKFCYAEVMARRLKAMGQENYRNGFKVTLQPQALKKPYTWASPRLVFVNSMSDLFHIDVPTTYIDEVFKVMCFGADEHTYQVLTKRSDRLVELDKLDLFDWTDNVWMGVSVEDDQVLYRIDDLAKTGAKVKWLSVEPLIGPLPNLDLSEINWVVVGGESGPKARPMREEWVLDIRDQCRRAGVGFYFKQWGGKNKKKAGRLLQGRVWDEMPTEKVAPMEVPLQRIQRRAFFK